MAAGAEREMVERATGLPGGSPRAVREDARLADDPRADRDAGVRALVPAALPAVPDPVPVGGGQLGRHRSDVVEVVVVHELDAPLAAAHVRLRDSAEHAGAAAPEDASIRRKEKGDVDPELTIVVVRCRKRQPLDWSFCGAHPARVERKIQRAGGAFVHLVQPAFRLGVAPSS
jgi:hypothetical protein